MNYIKDFYVGLGLLTFLILQYYVGIDIFIFLF